jgi:exosome complex component RRP41
MSEEKNKYFDKNNKRIDGRKADESRPIKIETSVIERASGSAYLEWGKNKVLAAVHGPREMLPRHMSNPHRATIRYTYRMAPFSVSDRKNPRPGRREIEISKVCAEALSASAFLEEFPGTAIDVFVTILDADAGTRIAGLTAAAVAMADAGIPMRDLVAGTAVGRAGGKILVDLNKHEEDAPDAVDMAIAMLPSTGEVVLMQMDGILSEKEFEECLELAKKSIADVSKLQTDALKEKYKIDLK